MSQLAQRRTMRIRKSRDTHLLTLRKLQAQEALSYQFISKRVYSKISLVGARSYSITIPRPLRQKTMYRIFKDSLWYLKNDKTFERKMLS